MAPVFFPENPKIGAKEMWFPAPEICSLCSAQAEEQKRREKQRLSFIADRKRKLMAAGISPEGEEQSFENYQSNQENQGAVNAAAFFDLNSRGLLLYGPTGTGKTHLAYAIANKFFDKAALFFTTCPELLLDIRASYNGTKGSDLFEKARHMPLLILDDIGSEKPTEWVQETIFVLVNHRQQYRLPTVFTSNCTLDEIEDRLGARVASRLSAMCRVVPVLGEDYRVHKGTLKLVANNGGN